MEDDVNALPVTALLATAPGFPVTLLDGNAALRMAVVDRTSMSALGEQWDKPGIYLLLDPVQLDGTYEVYVGKAPSGLRARLRQHRLQKEHWSRALLVIRDTTYGWDSAEIGWLEGRLYDLLDGASHATLSNGNRPRDETVRSYDRAALEAATEPIAAVLRLLGCSPDALGDPDHGDLAPDDEYVEPEPAAASSVTRSRQRAGDTRRVYGVSVRQLIEAGDLTAGERLRSTQRSAPATASLVEDGDVMVDGERFGSLSAAGRHVLGGTEVNGWTFWAVERDGSSVPLTTVRARYRRRQQG